MAQIKRCKNDLHYYDSFKYESCPYCDEEKDESSVYEIPLFIRKGKNLRSNLDYPSRAAVRFRPGDIFDVKCDVLILPCNTIGNVTDFVQKYLQRYEISPPPPGMSLGYVFFQGYEGREDLSKIIGFATSVDYMVSTPEAINFIGQQIGQFTTQEPEAKIISVPLLGTGAGGLSSEVAAAQLRKGFLLRAHPESQLIISILHEEVYERVVKEIEVEKSDFQVFLSYSSKDKQYARELYQRLSFDGIDTWFDEESLLPGQNWDKEIRKAVRNSDIVIVCLSKSAINKRGYIQKEIRFALNVAEEQPENSIFIIPLRLEDCEVPEHLSCWQWVDYFEETGYQKLLRSIRLSSSK